MEKVVFISYYEAFFVLFHTFLGGFSQIFDLNKLFCKKNVSFVKGMGIQE